jgi:hypothetical protein
VLSLFRTGKVLLVRNLRKFADPRTNGLVNAFVVFAALFQVPRMRCGE